MEEKMLSKSDPWLDSLSICELAKSPLTPFTIAASKMRIFTHFNLMDGRTDQRTNGQMEGPMDGWAKPFKSCVSATKKM